MPTIIWDEPGEFWDTLIFWDLNDNVAAYINLITSEHNQQPNFISMIAGTIGPLLDIMDALNGIPNLFDIDTAQGQQLDFIGQWVGFSRGLQVALTGVYFSLDDALLGLDAGVMQGPFDPSTGLVNLPDDEYRLVLKAKIAENHWDGSIPSAYAAYDSIFAPTGNSVAIFDEGGMHMALGLLGPTPTPLTLALFAGGYVTLRPSGVQIDAYYTGAPFFGFDQENAIISGLDVGAFGTAN
jgi:Protein of unknown function (DUF2612)